MYIRREHAPAAAAVGRAARVSGHKGPCLSACNRTPAAATSLIHYLAQMFAQLRVAYDYAFCFYVGIRFWLDCVRGFRYGKICMNLDVCIRFHSLFNFGVCFTHLPMLNSIILF